ncbi:dihydroxyacetone kinase [Ancylobacter sp. 3268]|uniref:dihydroxyacetone kinase subunit L n=1 Tax=Ancylobacter sp. 3268 TaxID=2817752 RepID=UPI0028619138|nr:dihydroxyacetone kinase subunit L [Ancylobacter sp. 3268]MDR6953239.1 dihydroxyacetone kinase [Ancylobacter sp. 3268]
MSITSLAVHGAIRRAAAGASRAHDELNAADGKLGDGDTGVMLQRLFQALAALDVEDGADLGATFQAYAKTCASATGSSLGTLVTVAMMTLAKATKGRSEIAWSDLGGHVAALRDQMMARGGANLGDKTVVDMIDAVALALDGASSGEEAASRSVAAARDTLAQFRNRPNRLGRARMFGEKTIGLDDPGMLAFVRLLDSVVAEPVGR